MNENMKIVLEKIKAYDKIIIFRHFRPDGDAIGSTKGMQRILQLSFPEKKGSFVYKFSFATDHCLHFAAFCAIL